MKLFISTITFFLTLNLNAQAGYEWDVHESNPLWDVDIIAIIPHGDFANNTHAAGIGLNLGYYYPFSSRVPLWLGLTGSYGVMGSHSQHIYQQIEISSGGTVIDVLPINLDVQTHNNIGNMYLSLRYVAPISLIRPYIEPKFGFNHLTTTTDVYDRTNNGWLTTNDNNLVSSKKQKGSFVMAYGAEVGLIIPVNANLGIKLGMAYTVGGKAEYYDETQINQWDVNYTGNSYNSNNLNSQDFEINENATPHSSTTNTLVLHIGATLNLN